jgi:ArsR family transcriptional regulator, arsenate/arsenite/antimonite-responsive transcriptional repressor / arsenate reductase (thioredoxin)
VRRRPPVLFELAGHPLRWELLSELAESDRRVRELTATLGRPQNLVSYHLRLLRQGGLVTMHRSAHDGRDAYHSLNLQKYGDLLTATRAFGPGEPTRRTGSLRVLFLCTGNSSRSQIAEALIGPLSDGRVTAVSAGSHPKMLHPNAVRVLRTRGIDISRNETKSLELFARRRFDLVITLCDKVREVCPEFPHGPAAIHWSVPDPAATPGSDRETYPVFEQTASEIEARVRFLLHRLDLGKERQ